MYNQPWVQFQAPQEENKKQIHIPGLKVKTGVQSDRVSPTLKSRDFLESGKDLCQAAAPKSDSVRRWGKRRARVDVAVYFGPCRI